MRRLFCLPILALFLGSALAADEPKLNTLTPKEVSDGWLLLFDGETTFGWRIEGEAKVKDGELILGGEKETTARMTTSVGESWVSLEWNLEKGRATLRCFDRAGWVHLEDWNESKPGWRTLEAWVQQTKDYENVYRFHKGREIWTVYPRPNGNDTRMEIKIPAGSKLLLRNLKARLAYGWRTTDMKSLFNGKDLIGWKEHPGKKSVFSVKDGAINIKDGPGDLQTEGQWADFVLQLECISNGKHLNSGVFFRCRPGEYQQGYEAQIHNGFGEQPKEYTLEDYDPETHKLLGTRKEKYTALDYGTGAIYRRQPARKQMSKDNEWFGMTVVAQGRHIGVWVNGVQVTDWTDNRPVADNARKGCMLDKGNISLQGHDPTTDLSFRNLRLAELAAEKPKAKD